MTRTEEEIGAEFAPPRAAVSKLASSLMWRTGQKVDVTVPQEKEMPETFCRFGRGRKHLSRGGPPSI